MRRIVGTLSVLTVVAAGLVMAAPVNGAVVVTFTGSGVSPSAAAVTAGGQILFQNSSSSRVILFNGTGQVRAGATSCATVAPACSVGNGFTSGFTVDSEGSIQIYDFTSNVQGALLATFYVNASGTDPSAGGSGSAPSPIMQQFGLPQAGTCDDAAPAGLNWGGASSGGWGTSWAEWMNGGAGGAVCTRTLVYRSGSWQVS